MLEKQARIKNRYRYSRFIVFIVKYINYNNKIIILVKNLLK